MPRDIFPPMKNFFSEKARRECAASRVRDLEWREQAACARVDPRAVAPPAPRGVALFIGARGVDALLAHAPVVHISRRLRRAAARRPPRRVPPLAGMTFAAIPIVDVLAGFLDGARARGAEIRNTFTVFHPGRNAHFTFSVRLVWRNPQPEIAFVAHLPPSPLRNQHKPRPA